MKLLHVQQVRFKLQLYHIRERQRVDSWLRALEAKRRWQAYLDNVHRQRRIYLDRTCHLCGNRLSRQCCQLAVAHPVALLRSMSGFSLGIPDYSYYAASEWADWNRGPPGNRACGPAAWDNAVRAWDEDR